MAKPYSGDLRERVVRAVRAGHTHAEVAAMFKIGERSVRRYLALWRATGSVDSLMKFGGHRTPMLKEYASTIETMLAEQPDATLEALQKSLASEKIKVGVATIFRFLKAAGYRYKKNAGRRRAETRGRSGATRGVAKASSKP